MSVGADMIPSPAEITYAYVDHDVNSTNTDVYTFSITGGSTNAHKTLVGVTGSGVGSGITISGVKYHVPDVATDPTGTALSSVTSAVTDSEVLAQWWQTETLVAENYQLVITWSSTKGTCSVDVIDIFTAATAASDTASSTANPSTDTIDCAAGGGVFALATHQHATVRTYTWSAELTELSGSDETVESGQQGKAAAAAVFESAQTGLTVTATPSSTTTMEAMTVVAFAPA